MDSVTTFTPTDLFWLNTKPSSAYLNRKVSWRTLRSNIEDFMADSTHTWALKQTFSSGATFSAGSNGKVTVSDSLHAIFVNAGWIFPTATSTGYIGWFNEPFQNVYSKAFSLMNTENNDSVRITYDDSTLSINKTLSIANLEITDQLQLPDSASFSGWALSETDYAPSFVTDSIITLTSMCSSVLINPPGSMGSPGIEKILLTGAGNGQILVLTNRQALSMVFQDNEADGNLNLASDFTMAQYDILMLKYNSFIGVWHEISRSDN
jgi:hypothetical protein